MEKNYSFSMIRLLAMLFVIFCHILEQSGYIIIGNYLAVGVQLFLLLSGYLYSKKEFNTAAQRIFFVYKNFAKILLDYYICIIFFVFIYSFVQPEYINTISIYRALLCNQWWWGIHHLWYIPYCLFCYMLVPLLYDLKKYFSDNSSKYMLLFLLLLFIYVLMKTFNSYFLPIHIICFILGYFLAEIKYIFKKYLIIVSTLMGGGGNYFQLHKILICVYLEYR